MTHGRAQRVLFVVALIVVATGGAMSVTGADSNGQTGERSETALQQEVATNVTFDNQTSNGSTVTVTEANLSAGGFVAIHTAELLNGSVLDSVIGTSEYLEPGAHEDVTVTLDEPINESGTYIAVAYQDTNGNEVYDFVESQGTDDAAFVRQNQVVLDPAEVTYDPTVDTPVVTPEETETTEPAVTTEEPIVTTEEPTEAVETPTEEPETTAAPPTTEAETPSVGEPSTEVATEPAPEPTTEAAPDAEAPDSERAQSFRVDRVQAPVTVTAGETVTVIAVVDNPTDAEATQDVELRLQGDVVDEQSVTIAGGEQTTVEFEFDSDEVGPGTHVVEVFTDYFGDSRVILVEEPEAADE